MKDTVRLAALRILLADVLDSEQGAPVDTPETFVRLVEAGTSVRSLCAATGLNRSEIVAALASIAKPPAS